MDRGAGQAARHRRAARRPTTPGWRRICSRYTARNTFDYFIHKDLGGFLRRELDFYIKNEVMHLDDVENETAPRVEQYLSKIKVIRRIAGKIIDFLAQLEDFQKKLWLKKKFVVETQYCITLDRIPEEFYPEIAANDAQREEWVRLFAIDEIKGDLTIPSATAMPLTVEFLRRIQRYSSTHDHFDADFTERLLDAAYSDLDRAARWNAVPRRELPGAQSAAGDGIASEVKLHLHRSTIQHRRGSTFPTRTTISTRAGCV